jgi:hypothetical protein
MYESSNLLVLMSNKADNLLVGNSVTRAPNTMVDRGRPLEDEICNLYFRPECPAVDPIGYRSTSCTPIDHIVNNGDAGEVKRGGNKRINLNSSSFRILVSANDVVKQAQPWVGAGRSVVYFAQEHEGGILWAVYGSTILSMLGVVNGHNKVVECLRNILEENRERIQRETEGIFSINRKTNGELCAVYVGSSRTRSRAMKTDNSLDRIFAARFEELFPTQKKRACALIPHNIFIQYPYKDKQRLSRHIRAGRILFHWTQIGNTRTAAIAVLAHP